MPGITISISIKNGDLSEEDMNSNYLRTNEQNKVSEKLAFVNENMPYYLTEKKKREKMQMSLTVTLKHRKCFPMQVFVNCFSSLK